VAVIRGRNFTGHHIENSFREFAKLLPGSDAIPAPGEGDFSCHCGGFGATSVVPFDTGIQP